MIIWFASGNIHKKKELADILSGDILSSDILSAATLGKAVWELKIPGDAGLAFDPEETGNSFLENALIKAGELYRLLEERQNNGANDQKDAWRRGDPVIADDSGLCVDALGGRPGIYSARYSGRYCGPEGGAVPGAASGGAAGTSGRKLDAAEKNALLLEELGDNPQRSARFVCAMVLYYSPQRFFIAQETLEGEIVLPDPKHPLADAARGKGGFGYDPILYIPELGRTVAELSDGEKNRLSHRGKAGRAIAKILAES